MNVFSLADGELHGSGILDIQLVPSHVYMSWDEATLRESPEVHTWADGSGTQLTRQVRATRSIRSKILSLKLCVLSLILMGDVRAWRRSRTWKP